MDNFFNNDKIEMNKFFTLDEKNKIIMLVSDLLLWKISDNFKKVAIQFIEDRFIVFFSLIENLSEDINEIEKIKKEITYKLDEYHIDKKNYTVKIIFEEDFYFNNDPNFRFAFFRADD